jgi:hypothetical protein
MTRTIRHKEATRTEKGPIIQLPISPSHQKSEQAPTFRLAPGGRGEQRADEVVSRELGGGEACPSFF